MIDVSGCVVQWDRGAVLQRLLNNTTREIWVGEALYDGTVGGAVRYFNELPQEQQDRVEMFIDKGVISGLEEDTIVGADVLRALGNRSDLPAD